LDADAPRGASAEVSKLGNCKRGAQVALKAKASYGGYTFGNVDRLCSAVDAKQIKLAWLHPAHELHDPSTMNVPRATIAKWLREDHETMQLYGLRGVPGERHWKVERDVRRRTSLDSAGGHLGTGEPMLGKAEEGLMVWMADQAKRGAPVTRLDCEDILRDAAITLKCTIPRTGLPYTQSTDVRTMTDAFLARCMKKGVPFVEKAGQGLSLQRAQAATVENVTAFTTRLVPSPPRPGQFSAGTRCRW